MTLTKSPAQDLLETPPYSLFQTEKAVVLVPRLAALTRHHFEACPEYRNIVERVFGGIPKIERIEDVPFFPVALFKTLKLASVPDAQIVKVLTSSGTTGQAVSRIHLDAETARAQSAVLVKVAQHWIGRERLPMIILDHPGVVADRRSFSARGAGILGMAQFGIRPFHALREDMSLDLDGMREYLAWVGERRVLLFGFTYMVWSFFARALERHGAKIDLSRGVLIHSGGWKKLENEAVSPETFRARLETLTGIGAVINFYGMVEQVGGVYFENPRHWLQAPVYSDVVIRDPVTLAPLPDGEVGLIEVLSCLPTSYPGHALLTEDLGVIRGVDVAELGLGGKCFEVLGRVPRSEMRGCSDTFQPARVA
jgi:phenylacetate-coenzyme A ligase PaaK-like adenylate-forming protein